MLIFGCKVINMANDVFPEGPLELPGEPERTSSVRKTKKPFPTRKLIIVIAIIALGGIAFGVYKFVWNKDTPASSNTSQDTTPETTTQTSSGPTDVPTVSETKTFEGNFPRSELTYPANWTAMETADRGIRVESPEFSYTLVDGTETTGHFRIYIRQGAREIDSKYIGRGVASLPSEILTYVEPAPGQRTETNLSFFGLDTDDHFAFFFIAGNFTLQKGDTLGPSYGREAETYIISGGYSAKTLADDLATHPVPLEYFNQTSAYAQALDILKSLKLL